MDQPEVLDADPDVKYYVDGTGQSGSRTGTRTRRRSEYEAALAKWKAGGRGGEGGRPEGPAAAGNPAGAGHQLARPDYALQRDDRSAVAVRDQGGDLVPGRVERRQADRVPHPVRRHDPDWRKRWGSDFPFYCVQLAPFNAGNPDGENWAYLREAQAIASAKVKNAGVAVITDAGDLGDIHPQKKEPAGARLALLALANTYGQKVEFSGPAYKSMKVDGNKAVLTFDHVGDGLTVGQFAMAGAEDVGNDGKHLVGFTVARARTRCSTRRRPSSRATRWW